MRKIQMLEIVRIVTLIIIIAWLTNSVSAFHWSSNAPLPLGAKFVIQQTDNNLAALLAEADQNKYVVRRVEFANNQYTRDFKLRRRVIKEEAIFTQSSLLKSLSNLRRLNYLKSANVEASLDRENKFIDLIFVVEENEKAKKK